jgi:hypothetical protein
MNSKKLIFFNPVGSSAPLNHPPGGLGELCSPNPWLRHPLLKGVAWEGFSPSAAPAPKPPGLFAISSPGPFGEGSKAPQTPSEIRISRPAACGGGGASLPFPLNPLAKPKGRKRSFASPPPVNPGSLLPRGAPLLNPWAKPFRELRSRKPWQLCCHPWGPWPLNPLGKSAPQPLGAFGPLNTQPFGRVGSFAPLTPPKPPFGGLRGGSKGRGPP